MAALKYDWFFKELLLNGHKKVVAYRETENGPEICTNWSKLVERDLPRVPVQRPPLVAKKVEGPSGTEAQAPPALAPPPSKPAAAGAASAPTGTVPTPTSFKQRSFTTSQQKPTEKPAATGGPNGWWQQKKKICQECGPPPWVGNLGGIRTGPSWPIRQHRQPPTKIEPCWHYQRNHGWCPWGVHCWFGHGAVTHAKKSKAWKRRRARKLQKARNAALSPTPQASAPQTAGSGIVSGDPRPMAL